jgi:hypothetical protein
MNVVQCLQLCMQENLVAPKINLTNSRQNQIQK